MEESDCNNSVDGDDNILGESSLLYDPFDESIVEPHAIAPEQVLLSQSPVSQHTQTGASIVQTPEGIAFAEIHTHKNKQ